ncbi:hypothetical protein V5799_018889 [Amblyomma americanum]|uniref:Uncharacterized protein n=1 Tax=Amblyomma americanum TaxID=6943 RepID=A0AAQ4EYD8_AMBAM
MTDANLTDFWFRTSFDATNDENFWSGMAGALAFSFVRTGFDQMAVQRFMAARTLREAKGIAIAGPLFVFVFFFLGDCTGIAIIYWFRDCDPVLRGSITSYDQVVPYYLTTSLSDVPVLRGIFLAGIVGASTSTVSSIVNSHAAIFYIDIVTPYFKISDRRAVFVMRLLVKKKRQEDETGCQNPANEEILAVQENRELKEELEAVKKENSKLQNLNMKLQEQLLKCLSAPG